MKVMRVVRRLGMYLPQTWHKISMTCKAVMVRVFKRSSLVEEYGQNVMWLNIARSLLHKVLLKTESHLFQELLSSLTSRARQRRIVKLLDGITKRRSSTDGYSAHNSLVPQNAAYTPVYASGAIVTFTASLKKAGDEVSNKFSKYEEQCPSKAAGIDGLKA